MRIARPNQGQRDQALVGLVAARKLERLSPELGRVAAGALQHARPGGEFLS